MPEHKQLRRLDRIWIENPIFFITTNTQLRLPFLANSVISEILVEEWRDALPRHGWMVGLYVIMPDHVHFFCCPAPGTSIETSSGVKTSLGNFRDLSGFMQQWKQWTSKRILRAYEKSQLLAELEMQKGHLKLNPPVWQENFFDHLLRSQESYAQKWDYVCQNPVRKGLVRSTEDWPWQGEIYPL